MTPRGALTALEVPRDAWSSLFDAALARRPVVISLDISGDLVGGTAARDLPLESLTHEDGSDQIAVGLGDRDGGPGLWHYVDRPRRLLRYGNDGLPDGLEIISADGTHTVLELSATTVGDERAPAGARALVASA